ncbi:LptM family lipoprotein [Anaerobium acetethylicum]|uniref:Peptidase propeptide and YPEB domain-containing protein n=1 Tax=Anaerobium acetethylicum TaxID=1619234 RepID=A0A1D3TQI6_9FIRM|nr:hypothetical protein [Anaerobium acetethylicum]SCP95834.1 hypothetical protein SAMN05421730_1002234 [Anaerobium acetethylicum]
MKKLMKTILVISIVGALAACGQNASKNDDKTDKTDKTAQEAGDGSGGYTEADDQALADIAKNEIYISASSAVETITVDEAVSLLSQSDAKTLGLESDLFEYDIVADDVVGDLDGIPVYVVTVYEKAVAETEAEETETETEETETAEVPETAEVREPAGVFYVITDGNAMYRTEFSSGKYINIETGEEIEPVQTEE